MISSGLAGSLSSKRCESERYKLPFTLRIALPDLRQVNSQQGRPRFHRFHCLDHSFRFAEVGWLEKKVSTKIFLPKWVVYLKGDFHPMGSNPTP